MSKSKQIEKNNIQEVLSWFKEQFPKAFPDRVAKIRPLQLGIMDEIMDFYQRLDYPPFSKKKIRAGLNFYTASPAYLKVQLVGVMRVDLYGFEVDEVNQSQADYAKERHQQYKDLRKKKALKAEQVVKDGQVVKAEQSDKSALVVEKNTPTEDN